MKTHHPAAPAAIPTGSALSIRTFPHNPNHHLWFNNGCWWVHCTVHLPNHTAARLRRSLRTADVTVARARRDALIETFGGQRKEAA
jgi:hypothetical protein